MSIVDSTHSKRDGRMLRQGLVAGTALLSAAVFTAAPKAARADLNFFGTGDNSWFNTALWATGTNSGTLPEQGATNGSFNISANNTSMPATGVLFDPANQVGNPNYIVNFAANASSSFYVSSQSANSPTGTTSQPNKLTIESGTFMPWVMSVGRDGAGTVLQNGGTWIGCQALQLGAQPKSASGTGTYEYHGGNYIQLNTTRLGVSVTNNAKGKWSATIGRFVVYNDGPDGSMLNYNGFSTAVNNCWGGAIGISEFHYDLNTWGTGGTRPVQMVGANAVLNIRNAATSIKTAGTTLGKATFYQSGLSSRLNLVLDTLPQVNGAAVVPGASATYNPNLGLFHESTISGNGATWPKVFYSLDGLTGYSQGATISAAYGTVATYSWTISYSGIITFNDTMTDANNNVYSSDSLYTPTNIGATGGDDVVLIGITQVVPIPEPGSLALLGGAGSLILARRRGRKS